MEIEFDPKKDASNLVKHGIRLARASEFQPVKVLEDNRKNYGETRYNMLAKVEGRVFHLTYTERGKVIWIISARKANKREQRRYEKD